MLSRSVVSNSFVTPWTVAHQTPLPMEFTKARILEWVAIPFSSGSPPNRDWTQMFCIAGGFFTKHVNKWTCTTWVWYCFNVITHTVIISIINIKSRCMGANYRFSQWILVREDFSGEVASKLTDNRTVSRSQSGRSGSIEMSVSHPGWPPCAKFLTWEGAHGCVRKIAHHVIIWSLGLESPWGHMTKSIIRHKKHTWILCRV